MPFAATWIGLEIVILSEVSQVKKSLIYMWNFLKILIYKTETDSQTQRRNLRLPGRKEEDRLGVWD